MKITIICVGKVKEKFYRDAIEEYTKRLSRYCRLEIIEVMDEKIPDRASAAEQIQIMEREAQRILPKISEDACICTLEILGRKYTSEAFAGLIEQNMIYNKSHIIFIIGGSLGLHEMITKKADHAVSFSDMTFPHQLMRVILMEQIYRAYRIINGEPYHK